MDKPPGTEPHHSADTSLRDSGIDALGIVPWGSHICLFYRTQKELFELLAKFFATGLLSGEHCVWAVPDDNGARRAKTSLKKALPDIDRYLRNGSMALISHDDWYGKDSPFDACAFVSKAARELSETLGQGFAGLRFASSYLKDEAPSFASLLDYETQIETNMRGNRAIAVCAYGLKDLAIATIIRLASTHRYSVFRGEGGEWISAENPQRKRTEAELDRITAALNTPLSGLDAEPKATPNKTANEPAQTPASEHALRESLLLLQGIMDNSYADIYLRDTEGRFIMVNRSYEAHRKKTNDEVKGKSLFEVFPEDTARALFETDRRVIDNNEPIDIEESVPLHDGTHTYLTNKFPIPGPDGEVLAICGIATDITRRRQAEAEKEAMLTQLLQSQKMEKLGKLSAGIAHDFNNIMSIISSYASLALKDSTEGRVWEHIEQIRAASTRAKTLIRQLLIFSKNKPIKLEPLNLNSIAYEIASILRRLFPENIVINTKLEPTLRIINADRGNIEQLLMNLLLNARDALPSGGEVLIKTENVPCRCEDAMACENCVRLSVEDNGMGMSKETIERLYEPFFTTKESGKGIGLGLTVVNEIVKEYGGSIKVESAPDKGTRFSVYLPSVEHAEPSRGHVAAAQSGFGERILLVEDERFLRKSVAIALSRHGYTVFEAASAVEAMDAFRGDPSIDLVFSDIILPDKNGIELVEELLCMKPGLAVILASGYMDTETQWPMILEKKYRFLQKPFEVQELLNAVGECLLKKT